MLQKEALLMPQAGVSESDTVTTQGFVRQKTDFMYVWSENYNNATGEKLVGKLGIYGIFYGGVAQLSHYPPPLFNKTRLLGVYPHQCNTHQQRALDRRYKGSIQCSLQNSRGQRTRRSRPCGSKALTAFNAAFFKEAV